MGRIKVPASKTPVSKRDKRKRPYYEPTFFNDQAKKLFYDHMKKREGVRERGIIAQYDGIINIIERRRWQRFAEQPQPAVLDVVREFYANARVQYNADINSRTVLVRGQDVSYDSSTINSFYGLEDFEEDEYTAWLSEGPNYDEVLERLCFPNSRWKTSDGNPISFKRGQLTSISRGWHYFISAKLLPTNHVSDVTKERALLNYAIQSRMTINVGRIIEESIVNCCTGKLNVHLVHPSLIYQLCVAAGVGSVDEEEQIPLPVINDAIMEILEKTSSASRRSREKSPFTGTAHPEQEDPITTAHPEQEDPTHATPPSEGPTIATPAAERDTPSTPAPEGPSTSTSQEHTMRSIQMQLTDIMKWQYQLMKGQNKMYKRQGKIKEKLNYLMSFGLSLTVMLKRTDLFKGVKLPNFPDIPEDSSEPSDRSHTSDSSDEEDNGSKAGKSEKTMEEASGSKKASGNEEGNGSGSEEGSEEEDETEEEASGSKADKADKAD